MPRKVQMIYAVSSVDTDLQFRFCVLCPVACAVGHLIQAGDRQEVQWCPQL